MYICHIVSTVDVNECIFCVNEQQKGVLGKRISLRYYCSGFSKIPFHGWAQVSRDKTFFLICKNFLDLGKILGLSTTFDLRENYLWIYELNQDLKLFSQFNNLFKSN